MRFCAKKIVLNSALMFAAAGIGLGVGFALRAKRISERGRAAWAARRSTEVGVQRERSVGGSGQHNSFRFTDDSPLATQLERDLAKSDGVTRWLYWMEALETAAASDFPRLARLAQGNGTATRFVAARWVEVAPRHLFDTMMAHM